MKIFVAAITHEHGVNTYAAKTETGINQQLAEYCIEYWEIEMVPGTHAGMSDSEIVVTYFEHVMDRKGESYECGPCELKD